MRRQGWIWTEEFVWHKKKLFSGKMAKSFSRFLGTLLQFNKQKKFNMYQESVMVPMGNGPKQIE